MRAQRLPVLLGLDRKRISASHPLRRILKLADQAVARLNPSFCSLYAAEGLPSVPPRSTSAGSAAWPYRLLRREGWSVNHKRVQRLWREEGLQRPTPRQRKRARPADGSVRCHRAQHPHQVWAMDFQFDATTADGRRLKFMNVIDGHSSLCLAIRVGRRCKAKDVVAVLEDLTSLDPAPAFIRSDNGAEFISQALRDRCETSGTTSTACIEPEAPWENGLADLFNGRFRDEFLNTERFSTAPEAQILADRWRWEYNSPRPHSAPQGLTTLEADQQGAAA